MCMFTWDLRKDIVLQARNLNQLLKAWKQTLSGDSAWYAISCFLFSQMYCYGFVSTLGKKRDI